MSTADEDTELRDLVSQTLEINGCLPKIRAELRASIFLALEEDEKLQKQEPLLNKKVKAQLESQDGRTMFCLVREFLEFFNLDFTVSVYEPESYLGTAYQYGGRSKVIEDLGISQLKVDPTLPLLLQLIEIARFKNSPKNIDIDLNTLQGNESGKLESQSVTETSTRNGVINNNVESNLNETFDVNSPSIQLDNHKKQTEITLSPGSIDLSQCLNGEKDDTCDGISQSAEFDKSEHSSERSELEFSPPVMKDKSHLKFDSSFDKLKLSPQKAEKLKSKNSLSSLADLPPLSLNKPRNDTVLLPSLYSKEFKEKSTNLNLRELDRFFDTDADYEEDFMTESDNNLNSNNSDAPYLNLTKELLHPSIAEDPDKSVSNSTDLIDLNKSMERKAE